MKVFLNKIPFFPLITLQLYFWKNACSKGKEVIPCLRIFLQMALKLCSLYFVICNRFFQGPLGICLELFICSSIVVLCSRMPCFVLPHYGISFYNHIPHWSVSTPHFISIIKLFSIVCSSGKYWWYASAIVNSKEKELVHVSQTTRASVLSTQT